jgi:hypothetical protein
MKFKVIAVLMTVGCALGSDGYAATVYLDKTSFLADSGATASGPLPLTGGTVSSLVVGDLTLTSPSPGFATGEFSVRLPGNVISVNALEHLNADLASAARSFGFDFHEPEFDPNLFDTFVDSTFLVTLLNSGTPVDSFNFNVANDSAAFVGVISNSAFDRVEIREIVGASENEFFGQFYVGLVPEPVSAMLLLVAAGVAYLHRVRRN